MSHKDSRSEEPIPGYTLHLLEHLEALDGEGFLRGKYPKGIASGITLLVQDNEDSLRFEHVRRERKAMTRMLLLLKNTYDELYDELENLPE